jgi:hypothetical protein
VAHRSWQPAPQRHGPTDGSLATFAYSGRVTNRNHHGEQEEAYVIEAGPGGMDVVAVGGPRPEGGDGAIVESPWPDTTE